MFTQTKLNNGLTLINAPVKGTKTVTVLVVVGTGAKYETKENNGISHFLEHMFFKGTTNRPAPLTLASDMDSTGGDYNAFTSKEYTGYWMKVDASKVDTAIDLVSDMLLNSKFEQAELEREKGVIIEEINMYEDNPMMHIEDVFEQCLYGDTPAGWNTAGEKDIVAKFNRNDFVKYFSSQYQVKNTVVVVAGKVNSRTVKLIEKHFSEFAAKHRGKTFREKEPVKVNQTGPKLSLKFKQTDQAHLSLGVHAYPYGHPDEVILKILSLILGGSMSSRLFTELREKRGLAYYVRTQVEPYTDAGYLTTQAGVQVQKIEEAIKTILAEYIRIKDELVGKEELNRIKDLIKGKIVIQLESSDDVASWYSRQAVLMLTQKRSGGGRKKIYSPEEFFKQIDKVTAKDIQRVARDIFDNKKLNLAVIGPYKKNSKFEKLLKL